MIRRTIPYTALLACRLSDQIPEPSWQEHLQDEVFVRWLKTRGGIWTGFPTGSAA